MDSFLELVRRRQSTRRFLPDPVPREVVDRCLEAARLAPSACNSQPWSFLAVDDPATLARVGAAAFGGVYAMNAFAKSAPVLVVVETHPSAAAARFGGWLQRTEFNLLDVGCACAHLILQAECEGLGSCWLGWFDKGAVRRELGLPRRARIDSLIALGRPAEPLLRPKLRRPLEEVRRWFSVPR
ncbi:MAG: nitroreductase family protein [Lentisphaeria bacterium]|jgi:nitroreductase